MDPNTRRLGNLQVQYQGSTFNLFSLYDIVGWILSVVGRVPNIANRQNYYYPLMMIGYVFCAKLIPSKKKRKPSAGPPEVWSVMWFKQKINNRGVKRVVVGANLDQPGRDAKNDAKDFRKDLLDASDILDWKPNEWNGGRSVMQMRSAKGSGQDFGHCAETYPLLFICS